MICLLTNKLKEERIVVGQNVEADAHAVRVGLDVAEGEAEIVELGAAVRHKALPGDVGLTPLQNVLRERRRLQVVAVERYLVDDQRLARVALELDHRMRTAFRLPITTTKHNKCILNAFCAAFSNYLPSWPS